MQHEQLWAPWRLAYITGDDPSAKTPAEPKELSFRDGADSTCFICRGVADTTDRENLIVQRSPNSVVILNRYPYNNGHLLIAPLAHKARLDALSDVELLEIQQVIRQFAGLLTQHLQAEGYNVGLNIGKIAGAGLPGHLHWHLVPRWSGDTNYMGVVGATRVIPQALDALWQILTEALAEAPSSGPSDRPSGPGPTAPPTETA